MQLPAPMIRSFLMALFSVIIASRSLAGAGQCDGNPDLCPSFENQCSKIKNEGELHFVHPESGTRYDGYCRNGLPDGAASIHFENGKLSMSGKYVNGKPEGLWKWYDPDGNLTGEGLHADGRLVDLFNQRTKERLIWIWEDGKLVAREVHKNGTPIQRFTYEEGAGETTMVEFEYSNGQWVKKSEKKYRQVEIGPCSVC